MGLPLKTGFSASLLAVLLLPSAAWADQAFGPQPDPGSDSSAQSDSTPNHAHWYTSQSGASGYTLARKEFELLAGLDSPAFSYYLQRNSPWNLFSLAAVRYGVLQSLTLDAGAGPWSAEVAARWNFAATGSWSFAVQPLAMIQTFSYSSSVGTTQNGVLEMLSLSASRELDAYNHLHLNLEAGNFAQSETYPNSIYTLTGNPVTGSKITYSSYQANRTGYGARIAAELEHRFNYRHGVSIWLSAQYLSYHEQDAQGLDSAVAEVDLIPTAGLGYLYARKIFWLMIGLELGPVWISNSNVQASSQGADNFTPSLPQTGVNTLTSTLNLAVGWRL